MPSYEQKPIEERCDLSEAAFTETRLEILAEMKASFAERMAPHFAEFDAKVAEIRADFLAGQAAIRAKYESTLPPLEIKARNESL